MNRRDFIQISSLSLAALLAKGCSDTTDFDLPPIVIDSLPNVGFTIDNDTICQDEMAHFNGTGDNINSWFYG